MASTNATTSGRSEGGGHKWAIVRHYQVLYSSDEHKQEGNRLWHDGKLVQHTFNGKLFLYDENNIELASAFEQGKVATELLADGTDVTIGRSPYMIEVSSFERVSRTDIAPLIEARERAWMQRRMAAATTTATPNTPIRPETTASTNGIVSAGSVQQSSSSSSVPRPSASTGPKSSHTFRTPFKERKAETREEAGDEGVGDGSPSRSSSSRAQKRLGSTRSR